MTLLRLIEKTILAQTKDQHPFATVHEQQCTLCSFSQNALTKEQWCERFNTKIDVGEQQSVSPDNTNSCSNTLQQRLECLGSMISRKMSKRKCVRKQRNDTSHASSYNKVDKFPNK